MNHDERAGEVSAPGDITLVIARTDGEAVEDVRAVLAGWDGARLLRPFLWWHGSGPDGHRVSWNGRADAEPLLDAIGEKGYRTVRLVSLLVVPTAEEGRCADEARGVDVRQVAVEVEEAVAARLGAGQRIARVNLIVAASGVTGLPHDLLDSYWDLNLVASDEDRYSPAHTTPEVRHPGRFAPHTAAVLATVAGLWPGMTAAPLDEVREGGGQRTKVRVVRTFVRALRCHGLVEGVTGQILDRQENAQWLADAVDAAVAPNPGPIVGRAVEEFFAGPGKRLCRQPVVTPPPPPQRVLTPWAAYRELWTFVVHLGRRAPGEAMDYPLDKARQRLEEFAQRTVFGDDSTAVVELGSRTFAAARDNGERLSAGASDFADALLDWMGVQPPVAALSEEWRGLRALTFGLVDAGPLPAGVTTPVERTRRLVVLDLDWICSDPVEDPFTFGSDPGEACAVPPCDPAAAAAAASAMAAGSADLARFEKWLDTRRRTLLWRVGERIAADAAAAEQAVVSALEDIRRPVPDPEPDRRESSRMYRALLLVAAAAIAAVATAVLLGLSSVLGLGGAVLVGVLALVGWLAGSLAVFYPYAKRQFRIANDRQARFEVDRRARVVAEHEATEVLRLDAAYAEFTDWATILGTVLHRPGGAPPRPPADPVDIAELRLPDAVGLSPAVADVRQRKRLAALVGKRHFRRGWASGLLVAFEGDAMAELKFEKGLGGKDPDPEPESDGQARAKLLEGVVSGGFAEAFAQGVRSDVTDHLGRLPPAELFSGLDTGRAASPEQFLTAILAAPPGRVAESFSWRLWRHTHRPGTDLTLGWAPGSLPLAGCDAGLEIMRTPVGDPSAAVVVWTGRLDASDPGMPSDLLAFEDPAVDDDDLEIDMSGPG